jgi:hypothetical protein
VCSDNTPTSYSLLDCLQEQAGPGYLLTALLLNLTGARCLLLPSCRYHSNARFVASVACRSIRLLPAAVTEQLDRQLAHIVTWASCVPATYLTNGFIKDAGMVPTLLLSLLQQQLFASVAYSAALQVVSSGDAAAGWAPLHQVRVPLISSARAMIQYQCTYSPLCCAGKGSAHSDKDSLTVCQLMLLTFEGTADNRHQSMFPSLPASLEASELALYYALAALRSAAVSCNSYWANCSSQRRCPASSSTPSGPTHRQRLLACCILTWPLSATVSSGTAPAARVRITTLYHSWTPASGALAA